MSEVAEKHGSFTVLKNNHSDFMWVCILIVFFFPLIFAIFISTSFLDSGHDWSKNSDLTCMFLKDGGENFVKCFLKSRSLFCLFVCFENCLSAHLIFEWFAVILFDFFWVLYTFLILIIDKVGNFVGCLFILMFSFAMQKL